MPRAFLASLGACLVLFICAYSSTAAADLALSVEVASDPILAGEAGAVVITVTNTGAAVAVSVKIESDFPANVAPLTETLISDSDDCRASCTGNTTCNTRERVQWTLGTLDPGQTVQVSMSPTLSDPDNVELRRRRQG
jgi:hypothetical protein